MSDSNDAIPLKSAGMRIKLWYVTVNQILGMAQVQCRIILVGSILEMLRPYIPAYVLLDLSLINPIGLTLPVNTLAQQTQAEGTVGEGPHMPGAGQLRNTQLDQTPISTVSGD